MRSCQRPWMKPTCSTVCTKAPWLVSYVFANTCSDFLPSNSTPGPISVTELTTSKLIKVNHLDRPFNCVNARPPIRSFGNIPQGFESTCHEIRETQLKNHHEIDRFMWDVRYKTNWHKRTLRGFVDFLLERSESYEIPPVEVAWPATTDIRASRVHGM